MCNWGTTWLTGGFSCTPTSLYGGGKHALEIISNTPSSLVFSFSFSCFFLSLSLLQLCVHRFPFVALFSMQIYKNRCVLNHLLYFISICAFQLNSNPAKGCVSGSNPSTHPAGAWRPVRGPSHFFFL